MGASGCFVPHIWGQTWDQPGSYHTTVSYFYIYMKRWTLLMSYFLATFSPRTKLLTSLLGMETSSRWAYCLYCLFLRDSHGPGVPVLGSSSQLGEEVMSGSLGVRLLGEMFRKFQAIHAP